MSSIVKKLKEKPIYFYLRPKIMAKKNVIKSLLYTEKLEQYTKDNKYMLQALQEYSYLFLFILSTGIEKKYRKKSIYWRQIVEYHSATGSVPNRPEIYHNIILKIKKDWDNKNNKLKKYIWTLWFRHTKKAQRYFGFRTLVKPDDTIWLDNHIDDKKAIEDVVTNTLNPYEFSMISDFIKDLYNYRIGNYYTLSFSYIANMNWEKVFEHSEDWMTTNYKNKAKKMLEVSKKVKKLQEEKIKGNI